MQSGDQSNPNVSLRDQLEGRFRGPLMTFFLRRVGNRADAEDLTQETLLKVIATSRLERIENAESFVFTVATNLLRDRKREIVRKGAPSYVPIDEAGARELERELAETLSPERVLLSRDTLIEALRDLQQLGERTYNIFLLFRLENMKQKDIAEFFGISQSAVEKHVMKAVAHLAARYGRK